MDDDTALPPRERAERYRALAEDAARRAKGARHKSIRTAYEILAAQWDRLATQLDALQGK